jgi:plastocyanin
MILHSIFPKAAVHLLVMVCFSLISAQAQYKEKEVVNGGTIRGTVRFQGDTSRVESMRMTKDHAICGKVKQSPRLLLGKNNFLANAIISLEGITEGKKLSQGGKQTLNQKGCEYYPHVMVLPVGTELEIVNNDPILHNVHAYEMYPSVKSVFNIAQPVKGQRTLIRQEKLRTPGFLTATCDAGHPWMSATILVTDHPYYTVTDKQGAFTLTDVPPGTYTLRLWHEGIHVVDKEMEKEKVKKYFFEEPYIITQEVTVPEKGSVDGNFTLTLR